ncbi:MAPEG family protein [Sphingosinicella rhizophila]|uniref:MAPEG family protein n=1 Tax=Sphingosinicella rhizophila TaxID=3050082 RepID=A0ABU3Q7N9_9SPHN|nr:MAPEG family protein [Sphingosinicella sp. GR2756]MDT9599423.1 MAPEG family protein [Sphingosinicella sp. GR2756]
MILPITLTIAGAAALLNLWIAVRVGRVRMSQRVSIGDGGHEPLTARMRAHSNFVEYTPFFLILLALIEMAHGSRIWLWGVAMAFILARIAHVFGMDGGPRNRLRGLGIGVTMLVLLGLALYAIAIPYMERSRPTLQIADVPQPSSSGGLKLN